MEHRSSSRLQHIVFLYKQKEIAVALHLFQACFPPAETMM